MTNSTSQKAIVTGASTGIGAAYARKLAERGYDVIAVARNAERLNAVAERIRSETGRAVEVVVADLADASSASKLAARITDDAAITLLVNNAGVSLSNTADSLSDGDIETKVADIETLIALNITTATRLSFVAARVFSKRGGGGVINIGSVASLMPEYFHGVYAGSKSYLKDLTVSLSGATKDAGVRFQVVLPGPTDTEMYARNPAPDELVPPSKIMSADNLVTAALVGFDNGEVVTVPSLENESLWNALEAARQNLIPELAAGQPASRYRQPAPTL